MKLLVNSLICEPIHNGHVGDDIPEDLEKHNEGCKTHEETKTIDRPIVERCPGLGSDENELH